MECGKYQSTDKGVAGSVFKFVIVGYEISIMIEEIKLILLKTPGIKAKEIVGRLKKDHNITKDKSEVNAVLYGHKNLFTVDAQFTWKTREAPAYITKDNGLIVEGIIKEILQPFSGKTGSRSWTKQDIIVAVKSGEQAITATVWNNKIKLDLIRSGSLVRMEYCRKEKTKTGVTYNEVIKIEELENNIQDLPF